MYLQNIFTFFKKHRKSVFYICIIILFYYASTQFSFAAWEEAWNVNNKDTFVTVLNQILQIVASLLGLMTALISIFLFPGWTNGSLFWLDVYLKDIWILVSNVVYFIFAFILIAIAFMNIIGKWEGTWELKQAMPKFIVGVLIVPFSWFLVQFILSISSLLTVGVLTLPFDSFADRDFFAGVNEKIEICTEVEVFLWKPEDYKWSWSKSVLWESIKCWNTKSIKDFFNGTDTEPGVKNSIFWVISIYTYAVLWLDSLDQINKKDIKSLGNVMDLWFKVIFDIIFILVYTLLMIALFLALFSRWVWLWVYTMLSPLFWLLYFLWEWGKSIIENNKFSISQFIHLALIPVYVSAALSFGIVFLFVTSSGLSSTDWGLNEDGSFDAGWINFLITWAQWNVNDEKSFFAGSWSAIWKLMVQVFGIAILWIAVMSALQKSEITKAVVEPIAAFGKSVGELAAKAPSYAPIIPTPGWWISAEWLKTIWWTATSFAASESRKTGQSFMENNQLFWNNPSWIGTKAEDALQAIQANTLWVDVQFSKLKAAILSWNRTEDLSGNASMREAIKLFAKRELLMSDDEIGDISNVGNMATLIGKVERKIDTDLELKWRFKGQIFEGVQISDALTASEITRRLSNQNRAWTATTTSPTTSAPVVNNVTINVNGTSTNIDKNSLAFPAGWGAATWAWIDKIRRALAWVTDEDDKKTILGREFTGVEIDAIMLAI